MVHPGNVPHNGPCIMQIPLPTPQLAPPTRLLEKLEIEIINHVLPFSLSSEKLPDWVRIKGFSSCG